MDCDKFDNVLMDLLYDELDELTRASAQRHADQCQRCRDVLSRFRATRDTSRIPLAEPPDGFEHRVLEAERAVTRQLPLSARLARAFTIASGYAMRPQLAMAALLLLVVGASLTVLRPKPGSHGSVQVTEHGAPQSERELVVPIEEAEEAHPAPAVPVVEAPRTATAAAPEREPQAQPAQLAAEIDPDDDKARAEADDRAYAAAMEAYRSGDHEGALRQFDAIVQSAGRNANAAELYAAFAMERGTGCSAALPRFDSVAAKNEANDLGHQAAWQSATCRVQLGQDARARRDLEQLSRVPAYAQRARQALEQLGGDSRESSLLSSRRSEDGEAAGVAPAAPPGAVAGTNPPPVAAAPQAVAESKPGASAGRGNVAGPVADSSSSKRAGPTRKTVKGKSATKPVAKKKASDPQRPANAD
jgi:hypothetical protein